MVDKLVKTKFYQYSVIPALAGMTTQGTLYDAIMVDGMMTPNHTLKKIEECCIYLGTCPRISILFKIEVFQKNKHSHIHDIGVYATCEHYFFENYEEFGQIAQTSKCIFGQAPS